MAESPHETPEARFNRLLTSDRPALTRLTASYARSRADRDDLLQEIAMALWSALPTFRGECAERTFLFRIAHNRCITHLARRRSMVSLDDTGFEPEDPTAHSERQLADEQQRHRLLRAIQELPLIYREVVVLMLEGMDYGEIAAIVGISASNVGVRLNRAKQQLKQRLEALP